MLEKFLNFLFAGFLCLIGSTFIGCGIAALLHSIIGPDVGIMFQVVSFILMFIYMFLLGDNNTSSITSSEDKDSLAAALEDKNSPTKARIELILKHLLIINGSIILSSIGFFIVSFLVNETIAYLFAFIAFFYIYKMLLSDNDNDALTKNVSNTTKNETSSSSSIPKEILSSQLSIENRNISLPQKSNTITKSELLQIINYPTENKNISIPQKSNITQKPAFSKINNKQTTTSLREKIISMDWREFELYIADLFNRSGYDAHATQAQFDEGRDVIAKKDGVTYYIECKHWTGDAYIGRELLQKLVGAGAPYGVTNFIFISLAPYSIPAIEYANKTNEEGSHSLELWGIEDLLKWERNLGNSNA